jgi:myo-inositol-1-phosphate synthase
MSGAVSTTFIAGVEAIKKGLGKPIGSLTQLGRIRLGSDGEIPGSEPKVIKEVFPLSRLEDLVFGGWDIFPDTTYEAALKAGVLERSLVNELRQELEVLSPMAAVFERSFVKNLDGPHKKVGKTKMDLAEQLIDDISNFRKANGLERVVSIWCGSTEVFLEPSDVHGTLEDFRRGLKENHPDIAPSMVYAYASIESGVPYVNGAPNLSADIPALLELADAKRVPVAGKDFKTGQTLMKTIVAPGLMSRKLGLRGWFSTNILGNRDGMVLDDPYSFKTKEESKLSVLESIFDEELYPDLYSDYCHKVRINYYPPRGDDKEAWDNIDIFGWLGYPMQIKINFLCKDSILAAPIVLDLALFMDLAQRSGLYGVQDWLSFYFKSPMVVNGLTPVHDIFLQLIKLKGMLRELKGANPLSEIGAHLEDIYDLS